VDKTSGDTVEVLQLCPELCAFEKTIKDRTDRLSNFRHPRFVPVRGVQAVSGSPKGLGVIADHIVGPRLSEVLEAARKEKVAVDTNAALRLIKELLSAISALHESRKVTHGAIAPERLLVTPRGRLVIVDYTLGLALERLQYNRARLWRDFRIAMPPTSGAARFDQRADVVQIGTLAVALLLGRPLDTSDYTNRLQALLDGAGELTVHGEWRPLSPALHSWLERALPLEARKPFATAQQAYVVLEQILTKERRLSVAPAALRAFISRYLSHSGGRATDTQEPTTDQLVQSVEEIATEDESLPSTEVLARPLSAKALRPPRSPGIAGSERGGPAASRSRA
jgi:serine/threonine protein kinase